MFRRESGVLALSGALYCFSLAVSCMKFCVALTFSHPAAGFHLNLGSFRLGLPSLGENELAELYTGTSDQKTKICLSSINQIEPTTGLYAGKAKKKKCNNADCDQSRFAFDTDLLDQ
ncbi:uncharacterized protein A4U43_C05F12820 [Asparagus officinalis]|uniref:Uncharacterized protein n=1 Tax=Asparagus officinalis TaxID=4686 RepID=A0A5P1ERT0_ASPOF|nr:uncharacterized protein LOC109843355 [Asparagus officinalis]ONK68524.1 uncharacterized protein A4U43_C05F12820 [Asparagus officinalis]